jgi:CRISPR-associated endonuclease/helicase Cas3
MTFRDFFQQATHSASSPRGRLPYPYQERFAEADPFFHLVRAPTGAGKTATAMLGWLWRYLHSGKPTPRRLVYCLPMRVLVEQSEQEARGWLKNLDLADQVDIHVLMGGVDTNEWFLYPEKPAVLIGTQDMLLSRALNRGYAAGRFHWPIDFGLLNNDCLWVFDEPQLMANGVSTSAQLAGLRQALDTFGQCPSVWMSATLEPGWLDTIDFRGKFPGAPLELDERDYDSELPLRKRMTAQKTLAKLGAPASKDMKDVARKIWERHTSGERTQTLVVLNTVERAKAVYQELLKHRKKAAAPKLLLVHSRFRPEERNALNQQLQAKDDAAKDRIIVATQVVEAGVDISAQVLFTELAPWASIVQRIGRCNRTGNDGPGQVFWIDVDEKLSPPYSPAALDFARVHLQKLDGQSVSPKALDDYKRANEKPDEPFLPFEHKHVLRRRDLLDLFDTSPDLSGNDIDIQRFVRSDDPDTDVQVFWRELPASGPTPKEPAPERRELCNVPIDDFLKMLTEKKRGSGYIWDHLDGEWVKVDPRQVRPGLSIMLPTTAGGYSELLGWDKEVPSVVRAVSVVDPVYEEATQSDPNSAIAVALTIAEHTQHVFDELAALLKALGKWSDGWRDPLAKAARWHDVGKALWVAQEALYGKETPNSSRLLAKSGRRGRLKYSRKHFRHELGSALAVLQQKPDWPFVVAYLISAHHGRIRLAIRGLPGEDLPAEPTIRFALGVRDGDALPEVELGDAEKCPAVTLDLSPMLLGSDSSWTARALRLLAELGPFKLAYLEALLRAADVRASQKEANHA